MCGFFGSLPRSSRVQVIDRQPQNRVHWAAAKSAPLLHFKRSRGPKKRTAKTAKYHLCLEIWLRLSASEVHAIWQWSNFLHEHIPLGLRPVRFNMDEAAIRLMESPRNGLISAVSRRLRQTPRSVARRATRQEMCTMFTFIAFVCDDDAL